MRTPHAIGFIALAVGLAALTEVVVHAGTVPLRRPTEALQVTLGAGLVTVGLAAALLLPQSRVRARWGLLALVAVAGSVVYSAVPFLARSLFGVDPGFVVLTFDSFEWTPVARFVLLPALQEISGLAFIAAVGVAILEVVRSKARNVAD